MFISRERLMNLHPSMAGGAYDAISDTCLIPNSRSNALNGVDLAAA